MNKKSWALLITIVIVSEGAIIGLYVHAQETVWARTPEQQELYERWWDGQTPEARRYYCWSSLYYSEGCPPDKTNLVLFGGMGGILVAASLILLIADWNKPIPLLEPIPCPEPKGRKRRRG